MIKAKMSSLVADDQGSLLDTLNIPFLGDTLAVRL